jgi:ABC-2 type transport system ATP-binding protein
MPVIEARKVVKSFGSQSVLREATLAIEKGFVVGLLGTNGSGKSTLIKCLLGLLKVSEGQVQLFGEDSWDLSAAAKARLGYVPQEAKFYNWMKVRQVVEYWGTFYPKWDSDWVNELMDRWEVPREQAVAPLSPGQLQRLALVVALGHHPELLILDEPVASLDPVGRRETLRQLIDLTKDGEHTVLFSTHILSDLERVASHIAILADGQIACFEELDGLKDRVKRLRLRSNLPLPKSFAVPGALRTSIAGSEALIAVANLDDDLIESLESTWDADVSIEDLSLEEIFLELNGQSVATRSPVERLHHTKT